MVDYTELNQVILDWLIKETGLSEENIAFALVFARADEPGDAHILSGLGLEKCLVLLSEGEQAVEEKIKELH